MPKFQNKDDEEEGAEVLTRQAWTLYQGSSESRAEAQERRMITKLLREADKQREMREREE